jgi:membrane protein
MVHAVPGLLTSWIDEARSRAEADAGRRDPLLRAALTVWDAVERFLSNDDLLRAAALTYSVALSIVPLLALAFAVLKGVGSSNELRPLVIHYLALGSPEVTDQIMAFVQRMDATALGSVGGAFLLLTAISMMSTVENAFNTIFRAPRSRSYLRRFSDYLGVMLVVPLFLTGAVTLTTLLSLEYWEFRFATRLAPYALAWAGFFFLFMFFPNTRVRVVPALIGSLVTAVLFLLGQWAYVHFQIGVARYEAIYGALASLPIFLVWVYAAWAIVLFGAELTAAAQRGVAPRYPSPAGRPGFARAAALHLLLRLGENQISGGAPLTATALASQLKVPVDAIVPVLARLRAAGAIAASADGRIELSAPPDAIALGDAVAPIFGDDNVTLHDARVDVLLTQLRTAERQVLNSMTLADLLAIERAGQEPPSGA